MNAILIPDNDAPEFSQELRHSRTAVTIATIATVDTEPKQWKESQEWQEPREPKEKTKMKWRQLETTVNMKFLHNEVSSIVHERTSVW